MYCFYLCCLWKINSSSSSSIALTVTTALFAHVTKNWSRREVFIQKNLSVPLGATNETFAKPEFLKTSRIKENIKRKSRRRVSFISFAPKSYLVRKLRIVLR